MSVNDIQDREERPPYVRFETRPIQSKTESLKQGRYVAIDVDYVLVTPPYSKDCVEHKVDYWLNDLCRQNVNNNRMPAKWLENWQNMYEKWKAGQEVPENGTSVKNWPSASPAEVKNMLGANIRTIEDMAACNDEGLKRLGMGAMELRNKAKAYLKAATDHGPLVEQNAQLLKDNERMEKQVEFLTAKVNQLSAQVQGKADAIPDVPQNSTQIDVSDILDTVNSETEVPRNDDMSELRNDFREREWERILPGLSRSVYEELATKALGITPGTADESQLQSIRKCIQEEGKTPSEALSIVWEQQQSNASRGLQQASDGDVVM